MLCTNTHEGGRPSANAYSCHRRSILSSEEGLRHHSLLLRIRTNPGHYRPRTFYYIRAHARILRSCREEGRRSVGQCESSIVDDRPRSSVARLLFKSMDFSSKKSTIKKASVALKKAKKVVKVVKATQKRNSPVVPANQAPPSTPSPPSTPAPPAIPGPSSGASRTREISAFEVLEPLEKVTPPVATAVTSSPKVYHLLERMEVSVCS